METDTRLSKTLTRDDIAGLMQSEGYDVSPRTIRYWESRGYLDRPVRVGRHVVHLQSALEDIRALAATRPAAIRAIRANVVNKGRGQVVNVEASGDTLIVKISYKHINQGELRD